MSLRIATLSVVVNPPGQIVNAAGKKVAQRRCDLDCPYCVSRTTPFIKGLNGEDYAPLPIIAEWSHHYRRVADGIPFGLITSKFEATKMPKEELGEIMQVMKSGGLLVELQTSGLHLNEDNLAYWRECGLHTLALSCVSFDGEINSRIMSKSGLTWDIPSIIRTARPMHYLIRVAVIMCKGGVDSMDAFLAAVTAAQKAGVHQLTFRKMGTAETIDSKGGKKIAKWIKNNNTDQFLPRKILEYLDEKGSDRQIVPWATIYSFKGMRIGVTEHMNRPDMDIARHGVLQPDGRLYGDWEGKVILG